jgi:hypothetical protein
MKFAAVFTASLRSGYALPACRGENATPQQKPQRLHLSNAETCPDKAGQLFLRVVRAAFLAVKHKVNDLAHRDDTAGMSV